MICSEAVEYIHSLLKFGIRPGLSGMDALLSLLGNPHKGVKCVHVAGTNGKGSTSTALSEVFIRAGYRVGLYTSPYVSEFLERIQFCGTPVGDDVFSQSVESVKSAVEQLEKKGVVITEFEALTAAAFLCFKELRCDVVILEVGLGGRLDATNVIDTPLINIITSLSIDHSAILGNTIEEITFEKCGTIKDNGTVVCSIGQSDSAMLVINKTCTERNNELIVPDNRHVSIIKSNIFGTDFIYKSKKYHVSMPGIHQVKNMLNVIEACSVLGRFFDITHSNIYDGISSAVLPARVEVLNKKPLIILDGGHNEDGAKAFYDAVKDEFSEREKIVVVAGMMADKSVESSLMPIASACDSFYTVTPENPRAMGSKDLKKIIDKYCNRVTAIDSPVAAVKKAIQELSDDSVLCVVGSLYLAGEVRTAMIEIINSQFGD